MYSYEDRIRAVELYIKLGKHVRPTLDYKHIPTLQGLDLDQCRGKDR
jgi:putative transposase